MTVSEQILTILERESRWLTFDELYSKIQSNFDWIAFAETLESLVAQGKVRYILPLGTDVGYYSVKYPK